MSFSRPTYIEGASIVHRCDARVKIVALLAFSIGIFLVRTWWGLGVFVALALLAIVVERIPPVTLNRMLVPVYVLAAATMLFGVVGMPSAEGLANGAFFAVRMVALVAGSFVVCLTSAPSDLLEAFRWFIGPLARVRVPVDDISLVLSLSLRFIPVIEQEFDAVRRAQRARGADSARSVRRTLHVWGAAFSTVFVNLFRHADALSLAMDARCYGICPARTRLPRA